MTNYPLLCGFQETIMGKGYLASVLIAGRALAVEEDDGRWWIYGVNPGAIAEEGGTLREAHKNLLRRFRAYLMDVAAEVSDFQAFEKEVQRFFNESDAASIKEWDEAVVRVRTNHIQLDELPTEPAQSPRSIRVQEIMKPTPSENRLEEAAPAIAA
ncbi:MAG: hypothetical protein ACYCWW_20455 [Deltaproteobacteria bacterium]